MALLALQIQPHGLGPARVSRSFGDG